jgi:hypothetical protein
MGTAMSSTPLAAIQIKPFNFKKNISLLNQNGSLGFAVAGQLQPDVAAALASNTQPFPARDIELAEVNLKASNEDKPIEFARGNDKIGFTASGGVFAGFGVYRTGAALLKKLGENCDDFSLEAIEFKGEEPGSLLSVLRWGYAAEGKANGAMALGAIGKAALSMSGNKEGLFAVIRRLPGDTAAREVVQKTADSWMLPRQVASIDQIEKGSWIIAEVMGGIAVQLGAQLGYDFNWVREAKLGGLSGDIGLRLQMGINAAVGFSASGRCAIVISRDSDEKSLRLRLFKLKSRELDLSLNASLDIKAVDSFLPDKIDDFISAVFDVHGQQILKDLQAIEKWTDPDKRLSDLLANAGIEGAEKLIACLAGVSPDELQQKFDEVHGKAVEFVEKWHELPHAVSSTLLKLIEEKVDLTGVRKIAEDLSAIDNASLSKILDTQLDRIDFFHTPAGRFLESVADNGVLSLFVKNISEIQEIGKKAAAILDGSTMEDVLMKFQKYVETELNLEKIYKGINEADFAGLDSLLKRKLADFLGQESIVFNDVDKVRRTIGLLLNKRQDYYEKALEALHRKYNLALNAAYQSSTTQTALFDGTFDFSHDPASVSNFFQQALQGKLDNLLSNQPAQVRIACGKISHGLKRQAQIDVSLPFMDAKHRHLNESVASVEAAPNNGGLLFRMNASDTDAGNQRKSVLSLAAGFSKSNPGRSGVRIHQDSLELNYTLLFARRDMQLKHVKAYIEPAAQAYFQNKIPDLQKFLQLLDQQAEEVIPNGPNRLGNGLVSLQVSLSGAASANVGQAWLSLPDDRKAGVYLDMSNAIQASLKKNVHDSIFSNPDAYKESIYRSLSILAYCAIVPRAAQITGKTDLPFWNFEKAAERKLMLKKNQTVENMQELLRAAQNILKDDSDAQFFRPEEAALILGRIDVSHPLFYGLLYTESQIIKHAFEAGLIIAQIHRLPLSEAVKAIADVGSILTGAFNSEISSLLGPGIEAVGTKVFLDASRVIDPARAEKIAETNAMLSLEFLKPTGKFDAAVLLAAGRVNSELLAFADRVVQLV